MTPLLASAASIAAGSIGAARSAVHRVDVLLQFARHRVGPPMSPEGERAAFGRPPKHILPPIPKTGLFPVSATWDELSDVVGHPTLAAHSWATSAGGGAIALVSVMSEFLETHQPLDRVEVN
ncbi:hypothetical protein PHYPSEUDO_006887 [Phytophthora pseudosyringae]|uniref:Uncharacterized protein n=1 Tax=Phytophthora pseudosyringae TaxID=221518 RepID=A0A8T1WDP2_9STRA|nr:hypothetical protein PHYPSEUDO_006887 [Phytophthora pseudosyringae]